MLLVVYIISVISFFCVLVSGSSQSFSNNTLEEFKTYLDENFLPIFMNRIAYHKNLPESASNITEDLFSILSAQGPRSFKEMKVLTLEAFIDSFKRFVVVGGMSPYEANFLYSVVKDCCDQFHISGLRSDSSPSATSTTSSSSYISSSSANAAAFDQIDLDRNPMLDKLYFEPVDSIFKRVLPKFSHSFSRTSSSPHIVNRNEKIRILQRYFSHFKDCFILPENGKDRNGRFYHFAFNDFPDLIDEVIKFYNPDPDYTYVSYFLSRFDINLEFFEEIVILYIKTRKSTLLKSLSSSECKNFESFVTEVEKNFVTIQSENVTEAFNAYSVSSSSDGMNVNEEARQDQTSSVSHSNFWTDLIKTLKESESNINKSIINIFKKCFKDDLSSYCHKLTLIDSICSQFEKEQIYHKTTHERSFMAGTIIHNEILKLFPDLVSSSSPFTAFKSEIAAIFNDLIMFTEMKWNNSNTLPTRTAVAAPLKSQNFLSQEFRKFYLDTFLSLTNSLLDSWTTVSKDFALFEYEDKLTRTMFSNRISLFIKLVNDQVNTDFMQAVNYRVEFSYLKSALNRTVEQIIQSKLQLDVLQKNFDGIVEIFTGFLRENYQDKFFGKSEDDFIKEQQQLKDGILAVKESQPQAQEPQPQEQQQKEVKEVKEIVYNPDEIIDSPTIISDLFKQNLTSSKDLPIFEDLLCSLMEEYDSFVDQNFTDSTPEMKDSLKELLNGAILSSYSSLQ